MARRPKDYIEPQAVSAAEAAAIMGVHFVMPKRMAPPVVAHLKGVKTPIAFDDAVTLGEAAAILGVHHTLVPRMLRDGKIVGRVAWSPRSKGGPRLWIVSRRSCLANVKEIKAAEAAGTKRGRPRQKLKKMS